MPFTFIFSGVLLLELAFMFLQVKSYQDDSLAGGTIKGFYEDN